MIPPDERETIITYNEGSDTANIYTHDKALQQFIEKELGIKPERIERPAKYYLIPKAWLRYPRKPLKSSKRGQIA